MPQRTETWNSPRVATRTNAKLEKGLVAYTIMAGAAGVGMLDAAPAAEAKVIYTPANISVSESAPTLIDLNNDGIPDFALSFVFGEHSTFLSVFPRVAGNGVRAANAPGGGAAAGFFGVPVGPGEKFYIRTSNWGVVMAGKGQYGTVSFFDGPWANVTNRYLGLKFTIASKTHFGWARLSVGNWRAGGQVLLTGYAYETIPNKNIIDGHVSGLSANVLGATDLGNATRQPASLGVLAQGAGGLALWRREDIGGTPR